MVRCFTTVGTLGDGCHVGPHCSQSPGKWERALQREYAANLTRGSGKKDVTDQTLTQTTNNPGPITDFH